MSAVISSGTVARFPTIINTTMTLADTEYSQQLPENCKGFLIHTRDESTFRIAFATGRVALPTEPYFTVPEGKAYGDSVSNYTYGGNLLTLYFASDYAGKVVEILYWV